MELRKSSRRYRLAAIAVSGVVLVGGCASQGGDLAGVDGVAKASDIGFIGVQTDPGEPVDGGTLTFGSYSFPAVLDPTKSPSAGSAGATEMAAVFDVLIRGESGKFVPQLAKSLSNDEDFTTFTITLRDNVKFSDGSTLDSAAVKWSIDRYVDAKAELAQAWRNSVASITTPSPDTVVFDLKAPWSDFPVLLSMGPGMIVAESSTAGSSFVPIGAGPFTMDKLAPNEEILLSAREDYYGGTPHLKKVRFVPGAGAQAQVDSLKSGQLDMTFLLRDESAIKQVRDAGFAGYLDINGLGVVGTINQRDGRPGADLRVREAIAYGVDPELIKERAAKGLGTASPDFLPESSRWSSGASGIEFDPVKAKESLDQAKADGYDGTLNYLTMSEPSAEATALAVQSALNSIGFNVQLDYVPSVADLVRKMYVDHDYDLTRGSFSMVDDAPYLRLYGAMGSDASNNPSGYKNAEMDSLLKTLQTAPTDDAKRDALVRIQELSNETVPFVVWAPQSVFVAWNSNVHGVKRSVDNIILLDQTWIADS